MNSPSSPCTSSSCKRPEVSVPRHRALGANPPPSPPSGPRGNRHCGPRALRSQDNEISPQAAALRAEGLGGASDLGFGRPRSSVRGGRGVRATRPAEARGEPSRVPEAGPGPHNECRPSGGPIHLRSGLYPGRLVAWVRGEVARSGRGRSRSVGDVARPRAANFFKVAGGVWR